MYWIVVMIAGAIFFYKVGDSDFDGRGWLFALISIAVSLSCRAFLPWGMFGIVLAQIGLFAILTLYNMFLAKPPRM